MAGHGRPVSAAMMLGDPGYAQALLRIARGLDDELLQHVVRQMDAGLVCGLPRPGTGVSPAYRFSIPYRAQPMPGR